MDDIAYKAIEIVHSYLKESEGTSIQPSATQKFFQ